MHNHSTSHFKQAFFINLAISIIEVTGGFYFGSIAILTDALHDFSDSVSLGIGWYFQKVSEKHGDNTFTYGYKRFSVLGAVLNGSILITGSIFFVYHSIQRFLHPGEPIALGMIALSIIGIGFNYWAFKKMHGGKSLNEKVMSLHLLEDVLGWVAVLIGGILIFFFNWVWIDPLLSISISLYIGYHAIKRLKNAIILMLQAVPEHIDLENVKEFIRQIDDVSALHDIHIWSLDGEISIMSLHISLKEEKNTDIHHEVKEKIRKELSKWNIKHVTIEIESKQYLSDKDFAH